MRFPTSFATAWFRAACSGARFGDPHSDFCLPPLHAGSRRRTQLAHGSVTPSRHGGTRHTSPFAPGDWGVGPTPSGGRSHIQGMLRKINSRGFRACPYESSVRPSGRCHPGRAQIQPSPRGRARHSTAGDRKLSPPHCKLPTLASKGNSRWGSLLRLCGSNLAHPDLLPGARTRPRSPRAPAAPRCLPKHKPLVLYTRHWTNSSTNKIKSFLHTIRLLKN